MLGWLKRNSDRRAIEHELFGRIVTQSRQPVFYRDLDVADTMDGRFEMIVLHVVLVLRRLKPEGVAGQRLGQGLMEALVATMDDALRQIGIGDMGVPKRIQKTAAALIERNGDYEAALAENDGNERLVAALASHIYAGKDPHTVASSATALARYVRLTEASLAAMSSDDLFRGQASFADVAAEKIVGKQT